MRGTTIKVVFPHMGDIHPRWGGIRMVFRDIYTAPPGGRHRARLGSSCAAAHMGLSLLLLFGAYLGSRDH